MAIGGMKRAEGSIWRRFILLIETLGIVQVVPSKLLNQQVLQQGGAVQILHIDIVCTRLYFVLQHIYQQLILGWALLV